MICIFVCEISLELFRWQFETLTDMHADLAPPSSRRFHLNFSTPNIYLYHHRQDKDPSYPRLSLP